MKTNQLEMATCTERIICFRVPSKNVSSLLANKKRQDEYALGVMMHVQTKTAEETTHQVSLFLLDGNGYRLCFENEINGASVQAVGGMMELRTATHFLNYSFGSTIREEVEAEAQVAAFASGRLRAAEVYLFETNFFEQATPVTGFISETKTSQKQTLCVSLF
ncbi:MAG: hypothetical protein ACRCYO_02665 [Bacteroidia bacterium]